MEIFLFIAVLIVVAFVLKSRFSKPMGEDTSRPPDDKLPSAEKENDKIIVVNNVQHEEIKSALVKFCNMYNNNDFAALPRLWKISPNKYAVTFPYDVDFVTYCFAVNFLEYPINIKWSAEVRAWATTKPGDDWITTQSVNKKVMLFLADDDDEYDNVFLTTEDGIGYKLGFAMGQEKRLLQSPNQKYIPPTISVEELNGRQFEDFK